MKRLILTIFAIAGVCALSAQTPKHTEWYLNTKGATKYLESGVYNASRGKGTIEFVGKKSTPAIGVRKNYPAAENTRKGDYWLMTIPVEKIKAGTAIALMGNTGSTSTGDHLHFELWHDGESLDPTNHINF